MSDYAVVSRGRRRLLAGAVGLAVAVVELQLLSLIYDYQTHLKPICFETLPPGVCNLFGAAVPRALGVMGALLLFWVSRPQAVAELTAARPALAPALGLNLLGFALLALPGLVLTREALGARFVELAGLWVGGGALAAAGVGLTVARAERWRAFLRRHWAVLVPLAGLGALTPEIARAIAPLWQVERLADLTFRMVVASLDLLGYAVEADPADKVIGADGFFVQVSNACSGIEGFALTTVFLTFYLTLFRREIAFPNAFLLFPIGIALSWAFNVLRIAVLLVLGIEVSPELAVGGFHSRAGWLAFITLAFGLIFAARAVPFFRAEPVAAQRPPRPLPPLTRDPVAAQLVPFAVFMLSVLLVSAFSETPGVLYPLQALAMAAALAVFWPLYRALPWRLDALSLAAGVAIGVAWIATAPAADGPPPFGDLAGAALLVWIVARVIGTGLLVPMVEELAFRGYLIDAIAPRRQAVRTALAVVVAAGLFAVLHDRWLAAFLSGLVFGALVARSRNVTDAILSHAAANLTIAGWVLLTGAWHVI